MVSSS